MRYNKVEYSTAAGVYWKAYEVKMPICTLDFSSSKIINHHFNVDNNKGDLGIGYYRIIGHDLMVKLGLMANFKRHVLQGYSTTVPIEETIGMLSKSD